MGLDIYFNKKRTISEENQQELEKVKKQMDAIDALPFEEFQKHEEEYKELEAKFDILNPRTELAYFRKVNFLIHFFDYEENCEYVVIDKSLIEDLVDRCKKVLEAKTDEVSDKLLPSVSGFFFGNTDYNEYYYGDVEDVLAQFTTILKEVDWDNECVEMYCWW